MKPNARRQDEREEVPKGPRVPTPSAACPLPSNARRPRSRGLPTMLVAGVCLLLALGAYAPYFGAGFSGDDFMLLSMREGALPYNAPLGMWYGNLADYPGFDSLWWSELEGAGGFLRPLSSWVLALLYSGFGRDARPYHLALAILHGLAAFCAFLVLRRVSGQDRVSLLAVLLFLVCEDHSLTVSWITTITDLLCAVLLHLALWLHIRGRQTHRALQFALSLPVFLLALGAKETAVVYPLWVCLYEFACAGPSTAGAKRAAPQGRRASRLGIFASRWRTWAPAVVLGAGYLVAYRSLLPPMSSQLYADPGVDPLRFISAVLVNLPVMITALLTPVMPSVAALAPGIWPYLAAGGALLGVLLVWALLAARADSSVWLALALFTVALLPGLAAEPGERLLYVPSAYGFFVAAWFVARLPLLRRLFAPEVPGVTAQLAARDVVGHAASPGATREGCSPAEPPDGPLRGTWAGWLWGGYFLLATVLVPLALLFLLPGIWIPELGVPERTIVQTLPLIEESDASHVVYLNTNSAYNSFYLADVYRFHRGRYADLHLLSSFAGRVTARAAGEQTIQLRTQDPGWLSNIFARIVRTRAKVSVGEVYDTPLFRATIIATTPKGRDVREVRFDFQRPLDDPSLLLVFYDGRQYRRWEPTDRWTVLNPQRARFAY